jgi:hypothetical protein
MPSLCLAAPARTSVPPAAYLHPREVPEAVKIAWHYQCLLVLSAVLHNPSTDTETMRHNLLPLLLELHV